MKEIHRVSFRCYFPSDCGSNYATHFQELSLSEIPKWIKAYQYTHPTCLSICVKVWLTERENYDEEE